MIRKNAGYTLIESAIVLMIIGLLLASFMGAYRVYLKSEQQRKTQEHVADLSLKLGDFLIRNGRYPCPARLSARREDPDYGVETICDRTNTNYPSAFYPATPTTPGTCLNGLCYEESKRFTDLNPGAANTCPDTGPAVPGECEIPKVRRGAIPFRTLGVPEEMAEDGQQNRLQYAVTEPLAVTNTYVKEGGGISIVNAGTTTASTVGAGVSVLTFTKSLSPVVITDDSAHFFIFSSGPDGRGAYSHYGEQVLPCNTATLDAENCNTSTVGTRVKAIYRHAQYSTVAETNAFHFDDFVKYYSSVQTPLWQVLPGGFDIKDLIEADASATQVNLVGIGVAPVENEAVYGGVKANIPVLQVGGSVLAEGNTLASQLCDVTHNNCFQVERLASDGSTLTPDYFNCPPGQYATGIGDKEMKCTANIVTRCGAGQILKGVAPDGTLNCQTVVGCLSRTVDLCTVGGVLDQRDTGGATQGQVWTSPVSGSSYVETWQCGPGSGGTGVWTKTGSTGFCVCNAEDTTTTDACNNRRDGNWSGFYTERYVNVCPSNTSTTTTTDTCVCVPRTETRTVGCPTGLTGSVTQSRDWICDSSTTGHWTAWTDASSTCACVPASETQTISCPSGYTGSVSQQRNFTCPAATWTPWTDTSNTCSCSPTFQTQTVGCASPLTGSVQQRRDFTCGPPAAWSGWYNTSSSCTCVPASETTDVSCGSYYTGRIYKKRDLTCPSATWGSWYETSRTCACVGGFESRSVACDTPLVGTKTQRRNYTCNGGGNPVPGTWYDYDVTGCTMVTYNWHTKTAPTGPYGAALPKSAGSACTTFGENSPCSSATTGGQYYHYAVCQCE